jgi:hypothetical protein
MTPTDLRARADREERIYAAPDLAKMLRAGADALDDVARLQALIAQESEFLAIVQAKKDEYMMALSSIARNTCCAGCQEAARVAQAALTPPADEYEFNARYDAAWKPEEKAE